MHTELPGGRRRRVAGWRGRVAGLLFAAAMPAAGQFCDLGVVSVSAPSGRYEPGDSLLLGATIRNHGPGAALSFAVGFYASPDAVITSADHLLDAFNRSGLAAQAEDTFLALPTLPDSLPPGEYYIGLLIIYPFDTAAANNTGIDPDRIEFAVPADLALAALAFSPGGTVRHPGETFSLDHTVANLGPYDCASYRLQFWASTNAAFSIEEDRFLAGEDFGALAAGHQRSAASTLTVPPTLAPGDYYIVGRLPYDDDPSWGNNYFITATVLSVVATADLEARINDCSAGPLRPGDLLAFYVSPLNHGPDTCPQYTQSFFLSPDPLITPQDTLCGASTGYGLDPGESHFSITTVHVPAELFPGTYYAGVIVSHPDDPVPANNAAVWLTPIVLEAPADLAVVSVAAPEGTYYRGSPILIGGSVHNAGPEDCRSFEVEFYASSNDLITAQDIRLASFSFGPLAAFGNASPLALPTLPGSLAPGSYYIGMIVRYADDPASANNVGHDPDPILVASPPVAITGIFPAPPDQVRITWDGLPGAAYTVQTTPAVQADYAPVLSGIPCEAGMNSVTSTLPAGVRAFLRVEME